MISVKKFKILIDEKTVSGDTARVSEGFRFIRRNFRFRTAKWNQARFSNKPRNLSHIRVKFQIGRRRQYGFIFMSVVQGRKAFSWIIGHKALLFASLFVQRIWDDAASNATRESIAFNKENLIWNVNVSEETLPDHTSSSKGGFPVPQRVF